MRRALMILGASVVSAAGAVQVVSALQGEDPPVSVLRGATALTEPTPPPQPQTQPAEAAVRKAPDGHFWAEARVEGRHVRFLVDTGASTVALTLADARRLGLQPQALRFDRPVTTAAGQTMGAEVTLDYVSVAGARVDQVDALVLQEGLETSLLGMTYLGRLSKFEASRDNLILRR